MVLQETGWLLKEIVLYLARIAGLVWSLARQQQLEARRRQILRSLGEEIRHRSDVPDSLLPLLRDCDEHERKIKAHRDALASQTPPAGWFSRVRRRVELLRAKSAWRGALRRLGEESRSFVPPERQEPFRAIEAGIIGEQTRRARLWEPWRALTSLRRMEIYVFTALLLGAAVFLISPSVKTPHGGQSETVSRKPQVDKEKSQKLALEFAQQRKAASPGRWLLYSGSPVLLRGELNQWDDFKVGSPVVLKEGSRYRMWYRGCHFIGGEYTCGVGHAVSRDGVFWEKSPEPVFVPEDAHESERLNSLVIVRAGDYYWMWYSVNADRFADRPYATIHLATSKDGLSWQPAGPVLRAFRQLGPALEPSAFYDGKLFHLWYADYPAEDDRAVMHLTSANGRQWQIMGSTSLRSLKTRPGRLSVLPDGRGGYRAIFPYIRDEQSKAGVFGMLLSADGNQWRHVDGEIKLPTGEMRHGSGFAPAALAAPDGLWVWFTLRPDNGAEEIRLAFLKEGTS